MLKDIFDKAVHDVKAWLWREAFSSFTRNISISGDPDKMRVSFRNALDHAWMIADKHPDLAVSFAGHLHARDWYGSIKPEAVGIICRYGAAAWAIDAALTHEAFESAILSSRDDRYQQHLLHHLYKIAPELRPGPWGSRGHDLPDHYVRHH